MSIPRILAPQTPPAQLKRERRDSLTPSMSDDEEQRVHARFLLNLASPEAISRTPSEVSPPARKKPKSRYANTITQSFSQTIRPAYEYMDANSLEEVRYVQHTYNVPNSPPQSPHAYHTRLRARPYALYIRGLMIVAVVQGRLKGVMRILNFDLLYPTGLVIKTMNHVQRIHKSVGVINAGAIKGTFHSEISTNYMQTLLR